MFEPEIQRKGLFTKEVKSPFLIDKNFKDDL